MFRYRIGCIVLVQLEQALASVKLAAIQLSSKFLKLVEKVLEEGQVYR